MPKIIIGSAKLEDVLGIEAVMDNGRKEVESPIPPVHRPQAMMALIEMIGQGFVWVARTESKVIGVLIVRPERLWYTNQLHYIQSLEFCIEPEYRKGGTASKLLARGKEAADKAKVPFVLTITAGYRSQIKDRFVEREGFLYMGGNLVYSPETEAPPEPEEDV